MKTLEEIFHKLKDYLWIREHKILFVTHGIQYWNVDYDLYLSFYVQYFIVLKENQKNIFLRMSMQVFIFVT